MSLIDQALQKAYQQRSLAGGKATGVPSAADPATLDARSSAPRELYLHKPQVPLRSHLGSAATVARAPRIDEPAPPAVHALSPPPANASAVIMPHRPELFSLNSQSATIAPAIGPASAAPISVAWTPETARTLQAFPAAPQETPAMPAKAEMVETAGSVERVSSPVDRTLESFHFHVTTQDSLSVPLEMPLPVDAAGAGVGPASSKTARNSMATPLQILPFPMLDEPEHESSVANELSAKPAAAPIPAAPFAESPSVEVSEAVSETAPAPAPVLASTTTSASKTFQVAWEVDSFQLPWACEQAQVAMSDEILRAARELAQQKPQVVWVSSLLPGEGRTSIAALLAAALASEGEQVLLLQGDAQAQSLAQRMGVALDTGWTADVADSVEQLADLCVRAVREPFTLLPAAPLANGLRPASLDPVLSIVRQLLPHFSIILIDAPAGFGHRRVAIPEAVESEIIVQDVRKTPSQAIRQILDNVPSARPRQVRVVQNFVPPTSADSNI